MAGRLRQPVWGERWELVGRERLLAGIEQSARAGSGIVLCGSAGVGKTRLVREVLARLESTGRPVEWVAATRAAAAIPFGAVSHLLAEDAGDLPGVLRAAAERFAGGANVIGVDDAHLLDEASAAVIHHLALRAGVTLLVTVRHQEPCPDAVTALWMDAALRRIDLPPLTEVAVDGLLGQSFGEALDVLSRRRLARVSAGNPLLLRETLRAGLDTGALRYRRGMWRWHGPVRPTTRLVEVVAARLGAVPGPVARVLELTAFGEPLPAPVLEWLCGAEPVAAAERQGLLVIERSGRRTQARLSHPLYAELIRSTMPWATVRTLAGELAGAIGATQMRRRDDALRVGTWHLDAGRQGEPAVLLAAADAALRRFDVTLAARLTQAACDSGGGWPAEHALARILSHLGWYEDSVRALPDEPADVAARTRWAVVRSDVLYWGLGRVEEAERVLSEVGSAPDRRAAEGNRALILMFDSRCAESLRLCERVLDRADAEPQAVVWAAVGGSASAGILGDADRARAHYERGLAVATNQPDELPWGRIQLGCAYCMAMLAAGRADEAWALTEREYREALAAGKPETLGVWAGFHGVVAKARGDLAGAARLLCESLSLLARYDTFRLSAPCLAALAGTRALAGDGARATRLLSKADGPQRRPSRLFLPWMELDRAWTQAAGGDRTAAASTARAAATVARELAQPTIEAWALYDAARLGDAPVVRARLAELAASLDVPVVSGFASAAAALAGNDPDELDQAATAFGELGLRLHAAEAACTANALYRRTGRVLQAAAAGERAATHLRNCPDARTPLLSGGAHRPVLTRRERDVATLAANGRTSRQIAEHLGLSVRTVDNHLSRAYTKLGVRSRAELATMLKSW